ncbi:MerR family transcriptional regulator [Chloroflexota bacterium]
MSPGDYDRIIEFNIDFKGGTIDDSEPCYPIGVVARMLNVHAQTLRYYERVGMLRPSRSRGNTRLYSKRDIDRLHQIKALMNDLGVNLAGAEIAISMARQIAEMEKRMKELELEIESLKLNRRRRDGDTL